MVKVSCPIKQKCKKSVEFALNCGYYNVRLPDSLLFEEKSAKKHFKKA